MYANILVEKSQGANFTRGSPKFGDFAGILPIEGKNKWLGLGNRVSFNYVGRYGSEKKPVWGVLIDGRPLIGFVNVDKTGGVAAGIEPNIKEQDDGVVEQLFYTPTNSSGTQPRTLEIANANWRRDVLGPLRTVWEDTVDKGISAILSSGGLPLPELASDAGQITDTFQLPNGPVQ